MPGLCLEAVAAESRRKHEPRPGGGIYMAPDVIADDLGVTGVRCEVMYPGRSIGLAVYVVEFKESFL